MPKTPISASATGLPCSNILRFPSERLTADFEFSDGLWQRAYLAVTGCLRFADCDGPNLDRELDVILERAPEELARLIEASGTALETLRQTTAFLAAMDLRLRATADRVLDRRARS